MTGEAPPYPPCPECGGTLSVQERFLAKPVGSFSLAGVQTKFTGTFWPHLVCDGCDLSVAAKPAENDQAASCRICDQDLGHCCQHEPEDCAMHQNDPLRAGHNPNCSPWCEGDHPPAPQG